MLARIDRYIHLLMVGVNAKKTVTVPNYSMSKRKRKPRRGRKEKGKQKAHQAAAEKSWKKKMFCFVWKYLVAISVIVGVVGFLYNMSSRISVACLLPTDSQKPFPAPFEVQNQGYLAIYEVGFSCIVQQTETTNGSRAFNLRTRIERPLIPVIRAGEKSTFYCTFFWRENIAYADIAVEVEYRPKFLFWKKEKHFRFVTTKDARGHFSWSHRALSE